MTLTYKNILSFVYKESGEKESRDCKDLLQVEIHLQRVSLGRLSTPGCLSLHRANVQNGWTSSVTLLCSTLWQLTAWNWKLPSLYIFQTPTHSFYAIHVAFPLPFVYLKTQTHTLFLNPQTNRSFKCQYITCLIILFFKMLSCEHFLRVLQWFSLHLQLTK